MLKCLNLDIIFVCNRQHLPHCMRQSIVSSMHEKVLLCGILLLEGQDGQIWKDYV
jgi:hypothetical protein